MVDEEKAAAAVAALLIALGVDEGDHTEHTPDRVARAWAHQLAGYETDPADHLRRTFTAPDVPGLVVVGGVRVTSTCAHHLLPITGVATVAYEPKALDPIVGLSKLARVVDGYARRLQVQERLGRQVVDAIVGTLNPLGAACLITATHGCMTLRGIEQPGTLTTTYAWAGHWSAGAGSEPDAIRTQHAAAVAAWRP